MRFKAEKNEISSLMRRLYEKNLTSCFGGNVSLKVTEELILVTPSGVDKASIRTRDIALMTVDGINLSPDLKPSIETAMHLEIYRRNADVGAVIHVHPPLATLFSVIHRKINCGLLAESRILLKEPVIVEYLPMGTEALGRAVAEATLKGPVVLLTNHGTVAVARTLYQAYTRVEALEVAARTTLLTELLNDRIELTAEQLAAIDS